MVFFFGRKLGMNQFLTSSGKLVATTMLQIGQVFVISGICENEILRCQAVFRDPFNLKHNVSKAFLGKLKKTNIILDSILGYAEILLPTDQFLNLDYPQEISFNLIKIGDMIKIRAKTIGKGYAGNIKRNNFARGPMSHGSKHHRLQGSLGAGTTPGRVFPGKKMSGHLGSKFVTIEGLQILDINYQKRILYICGSLPGKRGNIVSIKKIYEKF